LSHSVRVRVQGREYNLRSQQDPAQVQKVADFVEGQLSDIARGGSADSQDILALTLLNLAGQYLKLRDDGGQIDPDHEQRLVKLLQQLESGSS
jgi:cell division protein ZapA (FtsZ GTPase activity inhibitor)